MEVKVDVQSEDQDFSRNNARPLIHDRDPNKINSNLKVTNVRCWFEHINQTRAEGADHKLAHDLTFCFSRF